MHPLIDIYSTINSIALRSILWKKMMWLIILTSTHIILHMSLYSLEDFSGIRMLWKFDKRGEIHTLIFICTHPLLYALNISRNRSVHQTNGTQASQRRSSSHCRNSKRIWCLYHNNIWLARKGSRWHRKIRFIISCRDTQAPERERGSCEYYLIANDCRWASEKKRWRRPTSCERYTRKITIIQTIL